MDRSVTRTARRASLHLNRVGGFGVAKALAHMAYDRRTLARTPGLMFWKLLGTGHGRSFSWRDADPTTWGLFAVWESPEALVGFRQQSPYVHTWSGLAVERWEAELQPVRCKGTWSRRQPFGDLTELPDGYPASRLAVLTRARVRPSQWRAFARAVPPVALAVNRTAGLQFAVGIGEAPVGLQATFSLWDSTAAMESFAYGDHAHREVIRRTVTDSWYAEELFARFHVVSTSGTVNGRTL